MIRNVNRFGRKNVCFTAFNVALHKPAIQSSTLIDDPKAYHANYSTDGNFEGTCSSTVEEKVSWWQVDLLEIHRILAVELMIPSDVGRGKFVVQKLFPFFDRKLGLLCSFSASILSHVSFVQKLKLSVVLFVSK